MNERALLFTNDTQQGSRTLGTLSPGVERGRSGSVPSYKQLAGNRQARCVQNQFFAEGQAQEQPALFSRC